MPVLYVLLHARWGQKGVHNSRHHSFWQSLPCLPCPEKETTPLLEFRGSSLRSDGYDRHHAMPLVQTKQAVEWTTMPWYSAQSALAMIRTCKQTYYVFQSVYGVQCLYDYATGSGISHLPTCNHK